MENVIMKDFNTQHEIVRERRGKTSPKSSKVEFLFFFSKGFRFKYVRCQWSSGSPASRGKMPEAPLLWEILRGDWKNRTKYQYEVVNGGVQRS